MTTTISRSELERIRRLAMGDEASTANPRAEKNRLLREKSQEKKKNWPNTLDAIRNKKLTNRRDREEQRELQQQEVDRQEAEFRKNERLESIRRANQLLYEQTDKMKFLRVQQNYADVIVDRRKQVEDKGTAKTKMREEDFKYHESIIAQVREGDQKEWEDEKRREEKIKQVAVSRTQQLEEVKLRRQREEEEQTRLGLAMKEAAEQRVQEDILSRQKKAEEIRLGRMKTLESNAELREEKKRLLRLEEEAEKEREREIEKIAERKKAREDLEKLRFEQAQVNRQKIIDRAVELLAKKQSNDEEVANKQQQEFEAKVQAADDAKEARMQREWEETVASRTKMVDDKRARSQREKEESSRQVELLKKRAAEEQQREWEEQQRARDQTKAVKAEQLRFAAQRRREIAEAELVERERQKLLLGMDEHERERFEKICKEEIRRYADDGKPTITLVKALRFKQPELIPAIELKKGY